MIPICQDFKVSRKHDNIVLLILSKSTAQVLLPFHNAGQLMTLQGCDQEAIGF